jgi:ATP-dependent DNA helicase RecQ
MSKALDILKNTWNYETFRPLQQDIVESVLEGKDTLALLPTGGGKSICFQVPGLAIGKLTLVISPLIALMKDQVQQLKKRGVRAAAIHSMLSRRELDQLLDKAADGKIDFLYLSPERIHTTLFKERLKRMDVGLIAVDEAHCISQWGHDFRPAYREIALLRDSLKNIPVIALTASATAEVREDIKQQLNFRKDYAEFTGSYYRENLVYSLVRTNDKLGKLSKALKRSKGSSIVYAGTRRKTVELAQHLRELGINCKSYHAGMKALEKERVQEEWMQGVFPTIVSTNAFGMGIDKPNVRLVAHIDIPVEPESYFQEAGRAGRDGDTAYALVIWNEADLIRLDQSIRDRFPEKETVKKVYAAFCNLHQIAIGAGQDVRYDLPLKAISHRSSSSATDVYYSLKILEACDYIQMSQALSQPSTLMFTCSRDTLYDYQIRNPKMDPLIKTLLRFSGSFFDLPTRIDEERIAGALRLRKEQFQAMLQQLENVGLVDYKPASEDPFLVLRTGRLDTATMRLPKEVYKDRKQSLENRANFMKTYLTKHECRSRLLLSYFGELNTESCGRCDYCLSKANDPTERILQELGEETKTIDELSEKTGMEEKEIAEHLRKLEDEGVVFPGPGGFRKSG